VAPRVDRDWHGCCQKRESSMSPGENSRFGADRCSAAPALHPAVTRGSYVHMYGGLAQVADPAAWRSAPPKVWRTLAMSSTSAPAALGRSVLERATAGLVPYAPTIRRVVVGFIYLIYGYNKIQNPAGFETMLTGLGFPAPAILSWFVTLLELVGGAALIVGLLVRPIALLFAIEMIVSSVTVKLELGIAPQGASGLELDLALFAATVVLVILGAGRLSVDQDVIRRELI
jgi:putative oxidoreductase